jgi:anti-sigma-K factor RskA
MPCAGFSADTYDRYVLGLLDEPERSQLERQIREQCPDCLRGLQRSMNLWLVFATTLENAEPSADFRGRLVRIAELSRKVLTFPKNAPGRERTTILTSTLIITCVVLFIFLVATWFAGRQSTKLESQPATTALENLSQQVASSQLRSQQESQKRQQIEKQLSSPDRSAINQANRLQGLLSKTQAEAQQYKAIVDRERAQSINNGLLIASLDKPGARLVQLKESEGSSSAFGYAVVAEGSKIVFIASNLPRLAAEHEFQLWLFRKEDPKVVSAAVFSADDHNHAVVQYQEGVLVSSIVSLVVTEEPIGGSDSPSGLRILESGSNED